MAHRPQIRQGELLVAVIGEEDTVVGFLLAGVGNIDNSRTPNFLVVDNKTPRDQIEEAFVRFTRREDVGVILINQHIADEIRNLIDEYDQSVPTILEIPSKFQGYDSSKDFILKRASCLSSAAKER
nr:V-type proton ATPase subunit F [Paratrimastix eleionoma]